MKVRYWMFLVVFTLLISTVAFAGVTCATATNATPNGEIKDFDFVAPSTTNFYQFKVSANHSYCVAQKEPYDDANADLTTVVASENTTCNTAVATPTVTTAQEPAVATGGFRECFTAPSSGTYSVSVANANASTGRYISLEINDTTMYNVRWSTFGGFTTQWGFQNTSNQAINVKLTVTASAIGPGGPGSYTQSIGPFSVPANSQVFRSIAATGNGSPDIATPVAMAGFMVESNDGAAGALLTDAFFVNGTVIVPAVFQPVRSLQH